ncbi:Retrovirus-related Pol polyprotein from transposon 412 [Anthophora retusa]
MQSQPTIPPPIPSTHSPQRGRLSTPSPGPSSRHSPSPRPVSSPTSPASTILPDVIRSTDDSSDDEITITPQHSPTRRQHQTITHTRDRLIMRRDNIACFTTQDGAPLDAGANDLILRNRIGSTNDMTHCRGRVNKYKNHKLILLPCKLTTKHLATREEVLETLRSLYNIVVELNLPSFSLSRTAIDGVSWREIQNIFIDLFAETETQIFICSNEIQIPPDDLKEEILMENHSSAFGGHKGINKTYRRMRERYYWPSLKPDVQNYANSCPSCQKLKLQRVKTRQPMTLTDTPGQAFDKVSLDIVGPLPTTPSGHTYILTMQDLLTKYSVAAPLKRPTAVDTADAFIKDFVCRFGAPKTILTDQGTNFMSSLFRVITKKFRITQCRTTAFHPQSNGSIERSHHALTEYLKHYIHNNDWDEWLQMAMFSYNTSVHEGTHFTPHELVFGRLARVPSSTPLRDIPQDETYSNYLTELRTKLVETTDRARTILNQAKSKSKQYYDRKINPQPFLKGDKVFLLKEPQKGKFDAEYTGPHIILRTLSNSNVQITSGKKTRVVHTDKLKKTKSQTPSTLYHIQRAIHIPTQQPRIKTHDINHERINHKTKYATERSTTPPAPGTRSCWNKS